MVYTYNTTSPTGMQLLILPQFSGPITDRSPYCPYSYSVFGPTRFAPNLNQKMLRYWLTLHALPIGEHEISLLQHRLVQIRSSRKRYYCRYTCIILSLFNIGYSPLYVINASKRFLNNQLVKFFLSIDQLNASKHLQYQVDHSY